MPRYSMTSFAFIITLLLLGIDDVRAGVDLSFKDDSDLSSFVTRPEFKSPLFNVTIHNPSGISPGYWVIAPYARIRQESHPLNYYQACQTGPHIYDGQGNLVWSGACLVGNQNACDFRVSRYNNSDHLSALLFNYESDIKGHGIILNSSFHQTQTIHLPKQDVNFNMHELNIIEEGKTVLYVTGKQDWVDVSELGTNLEAGWIANLGFREVDIATGQTKFQWWALDHVPPSASSVEITGLEGPHPYSFNYAHLNSVDKSSDGDYLVSARFTDCIYKISGKDGSVIWRLGGKNSSFILDGFNFSKQHDARFVQQNHTTTIISFLDNASDGQNTTSSYSSALLVALKTSVTPMIAKVIQRWVRPDYQLSHLRGNFQLLPNGNAFIGWSENSYISEHTPGGELLLEARFQSFRFVTYRAYKFNFTGAPTEPPILKAFVFGTSPATSTTVFYVSWNGATEHTSWRFYRHGNSTSTTKPELIGSASRTGFETTFQSNGYERHVYAEAIAADGKALGRSPIEATIIPPDWDYAHYIEEQHDTNSDPSEVDEQVPRKIWQTVPKQEL